MRNKPPLDLTALATFVEVVTRGSFSAGARARGIPRPTATRHVNILERDLGVRLIERTTRSMRVTDAGADLVERARRILDDAKAARDALAERQQRLSGRIRISAPIEYGMRFLEPVLVAFARAHPEVRLSVELAARQVDLVEDGCDVALRIGPLRDSSDGARRLGVVPFAICAAPALLARERPPRRPEELATRRLLVFDTASRKRVWSFSSSRGTIDVAVGSAVLEANSYALLLAGATSGLGFARLPRFLAAPALEAGTLLEVLPGWRCAELPVHALFRRGMATARVRALLSHVAAALDDRAPG
ncbi:MAG TPA: LysR substrate-binding domain-containing protein [Kofleriaceae bacterium]|nr:LysR substrate-binding domain-containing protein [Kofleriaceae bacterium]